MRRLWQAGLLIAVWLSLFGCSRSNQTVARVGSERISLDEFRAALIEQFKTRDFSQINLDKKLEVLNNLLDQRRRILKARETGLDKTPEFLRRLKEREDLLLAQTLYLKEVIDPLIPEALIRRYYNYQQRELRVRAIKLGYKGAPQYKGNRSEQETIALARELVDKLGEGGDFKAFVQQYSDDPAKNKTEGFLTYPLGRFGLKADSLVYSAELHRVVGPVKGPDGYYIFRIEERHYRPQPAGYEKRREQIRQNLYNWYFVQQANQLFEKKSLALQKQYGVEFLDENLKKFLEVARQWRQKPGATDADFTPDQRDLVLARFKGGQITAGDLIDKFRGGFLSNFPRYGSLEKLHEFLEKRVVNLEIWAREARLRGLDRDPKLRREMANYERTQLSALLDQKIVQDKVQITETDLENYYNSHIEQFRQPERIRVWEIQVKDAKLAQQIARRARQGEDFRKLAELYNFNQSLKNRKGDLGYVSRRYTDKLLAKKAFEAGPNQVVGPYKSSVYYTILKTGDVQPERIRSLREVRGIVRNAVRREKEKALRDGFLQQLRKKYLFQINEALVRRMS